MRARSPRIVTGVLLAVGILVSAALVSSLPDPMAVHWNAAGEVDGTMPRPVGAFFVPAVAAAAVPVLYLAPRIDPEIEDVEAMRGPYEWFVVEFVAVLLWVHGLVLADNLGYGVPFGAGIAVALGGLLIGVGELLARVERNRHGAWAFRLAGLLAFCGVLVPSLSIPLVLVGTLCASVVAAAAGRRDADA